MGLLVDMLDRPELRKGGGGSMLPCPPGQPQYQQVHASQQQGQHPQQDVNISLPPMPTLQQYSYDNNMTYVQL